MASEPHFGRLASRVLTILLKKKLIRAQTASKKVDLFITENSVMRKLKKEFLKKDAKVVDVLSFPEDPEFPDPEKSLRLGEIHLNRTIVKRSPEHAKFLFIHGILHLLGYSHEGKRDTILMEKLEEELKKALHIK
jgi:probable rRNA maturation factor